ncbi:MAG TPA: TetR family transcriptional regulator C-terminal domain-containing protein [Acidobacteriota bacterium]|jgi:TetR/AcrR family transcriptional repressor of nem operon|nr:TetR family transcriptional regulator C-terminal domain-containing protein [Acidobacteriota bacterium]
MSGKREQIIEAASDLVHIKGFNHTSVDDILQKTGIKKGNFYFYFKSKEELGFAVVEHYIEQFRRECLSPILASDDTAFNKLMRLLDTLEMEQSESGCCGGCLFGNMALELSDLHEGFRKRLQEIFQGMSDLFYRLLEESAGELQKDVDLREVAQFIVAGLEGGIMLAKVHKNITPMRQCLRQLKRYLVLLRLKSAMNNSGLNTRSERGRVQ